MLFSQDLQPTLIVIAIATVVLVTLIFILRFKHPLVIVWWALRWMLGIFAGAIIGSLLGSATIGAIVGILASAGLILLIVAAVDKRKQQAMQDQRARTTR